MAVFRSSDEIRLSFFFFFFLLLLFSFEYLQLMLPEAPQPYFLLYYPRIGLSNFLHQFRAAPLPKQRKLGLLVCNVDVFQLSPLVVFERSQQPNVELCGREMAGKFSLKMPDFHVAFRWSFTCRKSTIWHPQFYFPSEEKRAANTFALKNPTASVGFEPAKLGSKGQHATSRPPKLLNKDTLMSLSHLN
jgi:hypothetical protein